ncbi:MAG: Asp-tRNA(Asn)/Glu-tRNA(Gln) amidotransferase subunit GatB [Bacteroidetes bacterium]|nr:Asp-tRNA(Asn)/Glu-tRNA(Gln) amidotransferase subunit GatB [Bacteroidota bacterium]
MNSNNKYQTVIGLEIHIQLNTKSKIFSRDSAEYNLLPNTNINEISVGYPGTLPKLNQEVVKDAVMLGLATNSKINKHNEFARKNYFYPDMPKGYQITQFKTPICYEGCLIIKDGNNNDKKINIERIHIEEDSGKSIHKKNNSYIDLNRAGVPLLELVTKPELNTGNEAAKFLSQIRRLVRYLGISTGDMEKGNLRCDANISIRLTGSKNLGVRTEIKNINSFSNTKKAINYEIKRQINELEKNNKIVQETRSFNADTGQTKVMRTKEGENDYRYFPEPDIPPLIISDEFIEKIKKTLTLLPSQLFKKYKELGLSNYDASTIIDNKEIAYYYEKIIVHTNNYKSAANWLMVNIKSYLNENSISINDFKISAKHIAILINLTDNEIVSKSVASKKLFPLMINDPLKTPLDIAKQNNLTQQNDKIQIIALVKLIADRYPEKVKEYKNGRSSLIGFFMGKIMKKTDGNVNAKLVSEILKKYLNNN